MAEDIERFLAHRKLLSDTGHVLKSLMPEVGMILIQGSLVVEEMVNIIKRLDDPMVICPRSGLVAQAFEFGGKTESDCPECGKHFELEKGRFPPHTILQSILTGREARMENY